MYYESHAPHTFTQKRLSVSQGGVKEFLDGGKLVNAQGAVTYMMKVAVATSDPIESFFRNSRQRHNKSVQEHIFSCNKHDGGLDPQ